MRGLFWERVHAGVTDRLDIGGAGETEEREAPVLDGICQVKHHSGENMG